MNPVLALQFASPGPILFELGPIAVRWYGFLIASAVLIGVILAQSLAKRRNLDPEMVGDLAIWLVLGAIPCARLYYVLFQWDNYAQNPQNIIKIWQGGIAIHGALIGATIAALLFARIQKVSFWQLMDIMAPSFILGQAIGRWGNFFNSEAFGRPTNLPWKLYIPLEMRPIEYANIEYFHPTFLYESLWNFLVFGVLIFLFFKGLQGKINLKPGALILTYFACYSAGRFWIEALRTDSLMLGFLRMAQAVSLIGVLIGVVGLLWLYRFDRPLPDVVKR